MFNMTDKARETINSMLEDDGNKGKSFRLNMNGIG